MFFVLIYFLLTVFFIVAIAMMINEVIQDQKNRGDTDDTIGQVKIEPIKLDNIYTPKEQFDFKNNLELDHLDGPFPEDEFETSDSIEYKEIDLSPVKKKKKISLTRREALLFAIVDEPKCKKGGTR